jgi:hypothetical protein
MKVARAEPAPHLTSIGHSPGVVAVPMFQVHVAEPFASADFGTSPCAELGPDLYVTVIEHAALGRVAIVTVPVLPRATGERTLTKRTNATGAGATVRAGVGGAVGAGATVGAAVTTGLAVGAAVAAVVGGAVGAGVTVTVGAGAVAAVVGAAIAAGVGAVVAAAVAATGALVAASFGAGASVAVVEPATTVPPHDATTTAKNAANRAFGTLTLPSTPRVVEGSTTASDEDARRAGGRRTIDQRSLAGFSRDRIRSEIAKQRSATEIRD